jgi:hypothetical protein
MCVLSPERKYVFENHRMLDYRKKGIKRRLFSSPLSLAIDFWLKVKITNRNIHKKAGPFLTLLLIHTFQRYHACANPDYGHFGHVLLVVQMSPPQHTFCPT